MNGSFSIGSTARVQLSPTLNVLVLGDMMMKTLTASLIRSAMFLSAGAFAGNVGKTQQIAVSAPKAENVTVILKNQAWPLPGQISVEPCNVRRCIDI